ncbi:MAG: hypothetical protein ACREH4_00080 [Vitreimonas sp.]
MRALALLVSLLLLAPATARAETLHEALDAYVLYQSDVTALLEAPIDGGDAIDAALERAARHDPARVTRGWVAYGALTAAQSPAFAAGVQSRVRAAGRAPVLRQLRRDLTYARRRPPGAAQAIQLVLASTAADSARMTEASARYEQIGRSLDAATWLASSERGAREERLRRIGGMSLSAEQSARVRIGPLAASPLTDADAFGGRRFWDALGGRASVATPARTWREGGATTVDRMLTLGALAIMGADNGESVRVEALLDEPRTRACLALEQLQFRQCASVAHDASEDAFCLARHGLAAPGACFGGLAQ